MLTIINQPIKVLAAFEKGQLKPLQFTWSSTEFKVDKIALIHQNRHGRAILYHFSAISHNTLYELQFNNQSLIWKLIKIYEGSLS